MGECIIWLMVLLLWFLNGRYDNIIIMRCAFSAMILQVFTYNNGSGRLPNHGFVWKFCNFVAGERKLYTSLSLSIHLTLLIFKSDSRFMISELKSLPKSTFSDHFKLIVHEKRRNHFIGGRFWWIQVPYWILTISQRLLKAYVRQDEHLNPYWTVFVRCSEFGSWGHGGWRGTSHIGYVPFALLFTCSS